MTPSFHERIHPSPGFYIALGLLIPAVVVVFAPINPVIGWILGPALYVLFATVTTVASPRIALDGAEFTAGRARIPLRYLGEITIYRDDEARAERGPHLDSRAYLSIRGALPVVKIALTDPRDPTPYWLVSTRRPEELAAKVAAALTESSHAS